MSAELVISEEERALVDERSSRPCEAMFVCASCGAVAGYYLRGYGNVSCPHCDDDAHPTAAHVYRLQ